MHLGDPSLTRRTRLPHPVRHRPGLTVPRAQPARNEYRDRRYRPRCPLTLALRTIPAAFSPSCGTAPTMASVHRLLRPASSICTLRAHLRAGSPRRRGTRSCAASQRTRHLQRSKGAAAWWRRTVKGTPLLAAQSGSAGRSREWAPRRSAMDPGLVHLPWEPDPRRGTASSILLVSWWVLICECFLAPYG